MQRFISLLLTLVCGIITIAAQSDDLPTANPVMTYTDDDGQEVSETQYDGSAPFKATFKACPEHTGNYSPLYEWRFTRSGETAPFLVRYDQDTEYEFLQSGTFSIELRVSFVQGTDTIAYEMDEPFSIAISESKLEVPNAFTPNAMASTTCSASRRGTRASCRSRPWCSTVGARNSMSGPTLPVVGTAAAPAMQCPMADTTSTFRHAVPTASIITSKR